MRLHSARTLISLFAVSTSVLAAIGHGRTANAQIIPTPGFPYEMYKIGNGGSVHFCLITDTELTYSEKRNGSAQLVCRNYITGVETKFDQINSLLAANSVSVYDVHESPDGKWVAWPGSIRARSGICVASLTGKQYRVIETPEARVISWAPETDIIVCFSSDGSEYTRLQYYNTKSGELDSDFHIARHSGLAGLDDGGGRRLLVCFCPLVNHRAWSVTIPPAFKTGSTRFGLGGACAFEMYELSNTALAKTGYAVDLPPKSDLIRAVVSPHQKYVIWQFGFQRTTELWISDMNGMHMRRADHHVLVTVRMQLTLTLIHQLPM